MHEKTVVTERRDGVLVIELNRPGSRNAIDLLAAELLAAALTHLDRDPELRVGVLGGRGEDFCAGQDPDALQAGERAEIPGRGFAGLVETQPAKPLIAAVEGAAIGGGLEVALSCDLIVAARTATFSFPPAEPGLLPTRDTLTRLARQLPGKLAGEMALAGRIMSAPEARELGIVSRLAEPDGALAGALELARSVL